MPKQECGDVKNSVMRRADWVSLKEYVDARLEAVCHVIDKSEQVLQARMDGLNEFRGTLADQQVKFLTKEEYRARSDALEKDSVTFKEFMAEHRGKASQGSMVFTAAIAIVALIVGIIRLIIK